MKKLSFCYVSAQFFPHMGGVEKYTYNLSKELVRQGHSVTIVTSSNQGEKDMDEREGIRIIRLPAYQLMDGRYPIIRKNREFDIMSKFLEKQKFDRVIVNTRFYFLSIWGANLAKKKQIPCILIEHGTAHLKMGSKMTDILAAWAEHMFAAWIKRYHPICMGVSKAACEWLKHFKINAKGVAYNSVEFEKIENLLHACKPFAREKYQIDQNTAMIMYAGRLVKEKGILQLIDAVKEISKTTPVALMIAGDGPLEAEIKKEKGQIHYIGKMEFEQIISLMKECDIFCLPSDSEGFPTVVLEAAACGKCVIATTYGGTGEILLKDEYGVLLKNNKMETIKEGLLSILDHPQARKLKGENLHNFVVKRFTWQNTAEAIINVI